MISSWWHGLKWSLFIKGFFTIYISYSVRNDANIDLAAVCASISDPKDPRLREFGPFFRKTVADTNAPVQEKALDALIVFLRVADADVGRYAKEVCDAIVTKCLTGRPKTVEKAQAIFMLWVELEAVEAFLNSDLRGWLLRFFSGEGVRRIPADRGKDGGGCGGIRIYTVYIH